MTNDFAPYDPTRLPAAVLGYLNAHDEERHDDARSLFALDAIVVDDGSTYFGIDKIGGWLQRSSDEYEYTSNRIGQRQDNGSHVTVQIRLDGNFPGETVTLRYLFTLKEGHITRLEIAV